ncbi:M13 family metallopeptidase [Nocardia abscessus]|uniref:M13 family metallopeptidase n=1 Tax=Nocardia abscessus TaxID=120957 RepID=UPI000A069A7C|nr:M13 family metallopeptidase [Nocardia abscessus]
MTVTPFGRRAFLLALGVVPVACSSESTKPEGPDLSEADNAIRPQDDLYLHVNGTWLRTYQLPPDKSRYGSFEEMDERARHNLNAILKGIDDDAAPGSPEQKLRDLYRGCLDIDTIERQGTKPIADLLAAVDNAATKSDLAYVAGQLVMTGGFRTQFQTTPLQLYVGVDPKDSTRYLPRMAQSGLGMSDEAYYRDLPKAPIRDAYRTYLQRLGAGAGLPDPVGTAQRVLDLETGIAAGHWNQVDTRDADRTYNIRSWAELRTQAPGFDWDSWLAAISESPAEFATVVVDEPSYVTAFAQLWVDTDIAVWREYFTLAIVRAFAPFLKKDFADADFDFAGKTLKGLEQPEDRWKLAVRLINTTAGELLGQKYVAEHFPPEAKKQALDLVANLREAYRERFQRTEWMSKATRDAAIAKLDKVQPMIGYPDKWRDYSNLYVTKDQLVTSIRAANVFESRRQLAKLGTPVDRGEWGMTPQTVNAYYAASMNMIVFPAGILQPPFFDPDADPAVNYGGIGAMIGHELGHGFDDQGSRYDGDGILHDWWTPEDRAAFAERADMLIAQYDKLVPDGVPPDQHVNGKFTVGENLADLRGFATSLAAYRIAMQKRGAALDYTAVFMAWARTWREKRRHEATADQVATDPHSPNEFRCNQPVRNLPEFYATFTVQPTDKLWLPEEQRVTI